MAYIVVWVLEGGVRKWVPGTESIFYVFRDVLLGTALILFVIAGVPRRKSIWWSVFWGSVLTVVVLSGLHAIVGEIAPTILAVGIRAYLAPLLVIVFAASYVPLDGLERAKRAVMWLVIINLVVAAVQVVSDPSAAINIQVGGEEAGFVNAGTTVRASGTFSAPAGLVAFGLIGTAITAAAVFEPHGQRNVLPRAGLLASMLLALLSGSRSYLLGVAIILGVLLYAALIRRGRMLLRVLLILGVVAGLSAAALSYWFPSVVDSFLTRFDQASQSEDTVARILNNTFAALWGPFDFFGSGPGTRGNVAVATGATSSSQWVEGESGRWVAELGILGLALVLLKLIYAAGLAWIVLTRSARLPLSAVLLLAVIVPTLLYGSITQQPAAQGAFGVSVALLGLELRSQRERDSGKPSAEAAE